MIGVDLIGQIRRAYFEQQRPIKEIVRTLSVSRATVRKVIRGHATEFKYERGVQPAPNLERSRNSSNRRWDGGGVPAAAGCFLLQLSFRTSTHSPSFGAHDSVHRFAKAWRNERARVPVHAYVPMSLRPESLPVRLEPRDDHTPDLPLTIKAAHMKLSHSRMPFVRAYFRETQELVFDAHDKAFQFYGGVCRRGIYDNVKTAVEAIFVGKARQYNRRFLQMCSHHLIEPVACTPALGWEKGQVENQVVICPTKCSGPSRA